MRNFFFLYIYSIYDIIAHSKVGYDPLGRKSEEKRYFSLAITILTQQKRVVQG